jgi:hypothetical protein
MRGSYSKEWLRVRFKIGGNVAALSKSSQAMMPRNQM